MRIGSSARSTTSCSTPSPARSSTSVSPSPAKLPASVSMRTARSQRTSPAAPSKYAWSAFTTSDGGSRSTSTSRPSIGLNRRISTSPSSAPDSSARRGTFIRPVFAAIAITRPSRRNIRARGSFMRSLLPASGSSCAALYCCASRPSSSATCTHAPSVRRIAVCSESEPLARSSSSAVATRGESSASASLMRFSRRAAPDPRSRLRSRLSAATMTSTAKAPAGTANTRPLRRRSSSPSARRKFTAHPRSVRARPSPPAPDAPGRTAAPRRSSAPAP